MSRGEFSKVTKEKGVARRIVLLGDFCPVGAEAEARASIWRPFGTVRKAFGEDSLVLANLECPLTTQSQGLPFKWANLKASPNVAPVLEGLDIAALANNHFHGLGNFFFGPATVQETGKDGKMVVRALTSTPANRESLAVSFALGKDGKSLDLENVRPFLQTAELDIRPAGTEELTFDLARANQRLATYVASRGQELEGSEEPVLSVVMHDGIQNVRHSEKPVEVVERGARGTRRPLQRGTLTGRREARGQALKSKLLSLPGVRGASTAALR